MKQDNGSNQQKDEGKEGCSDEDNRADSFIHHTRLGDLWGGWGGWLGGVTGINLFWGTSEGPCLFYNLV